MHMRKHTLHDTYSQMGNNRKLNSSQEEEDMRIQSLPRNVCKLIKITLF